jgi:GDPmannose 4,6-dehydratase
MFNHESPRRGETFVTRKITRAIANISQGVEQCLFLGNLDALRDWGHAKDSVEVMWLMLQQNQPDDFVIATGKQHSVRQFVELAANELGISIEWQGSGVNETGVVSKISGDALEHLKVGDVIVRVDTKYFRPAEVDSLIGDASKAKELLNWQPKVNFNQLVVEMVNNDLFAAKKNALLKSHGYDVNLSNKN